jgi:Uma2 family endonuclease
MSGATAQGLTYEQYLALSASADGLLEYHDGLVVARVAPSPEHARLIARLVRLLELPVSSARRCAALPAGLKVRIEATNRTLIPDVTVVCGALERSSVDAQAITNPVAVFEVLSPTTESYDLGAKFHQYRRLPSLQEYVVVAQDRRFVSISRRAGDLWSFEDLGAGAVVRLQSLELELSIDALYCDALGEIA